MASNNPGKKIGIYGGTFDPIHNGHLRVVVELISRKVVDRIILIPAGQPRLREQAPIADGQTRLKMCELAISDLPLSVKDSVTVSDIEIKRNGPTYAIDTVLELNQNNKQNNDELYWIIGSDAYANIDKWHRAEELKELVSFIVIDRPSNTGGGTADNNGDNGDAIDIDALNLSATQVRSDREVNGVSPSVRKFITERKLYASK